MAEETPEPSPPPATPSMLDSDNAAPPQEGTYGVTSDDRIWTEESNPRQWYRPRNKTSRGPTDSVQPPQMSPFKYQDTPVPFQRRTSSPRSTAVVHPSDVPTPEPVRPLRTKKKYKWFIKRKRSSLSKSGSEEPIKQQEPLAMKETPFELLDRDVASGAVPPQDVVEDIERTRHGTIHEDQTGALTHEDEAGYQMFITPPVRQRTLPPGIIIDAGDIAVPSHSSQELNTSTWSTTPARLAPPISKLPMSSPGARTPSKGTPYDTSRPTCSLNVVCYRSGADGCELKQIQTVLESRFRSRDAFNRTCEQNKQLISTDQDLFVELRRIYMKDMCGFWRRHLSLKTLRGLRVLSYSPVNRPSVVPFDDFVLQEMLYAYSNPSKVTSEHLWIEWVFRLRRGEQRHALELVEDWNTKRIMIAGSGPWFVSCLFGIIWAVCTKDIQGAFTVASFILTGATIALALLAVISGIESSGKAHMHA